VDAHEHTELLNETFGEPGTIGRLQERISSLERRVEELERGNKAEKVKRVTRRRANQICRKYQVRLLIIQCAHRGCEKLYGSETSLRNHLKLKHCLSQSTPSLN
jgi:hypothetical protein